jgi:cell division septum initiation protein DivIVA
MDEGVDQVDPGAWRVPVDASSVLRTDFQQVRKGFDPDEVTAHLGRVAEHVADLETRIQDLESKLERQPPSPDAQAADPYEIVAARIADLVRTFDHDVERLRGDAQTEADRILREAKADAERTERETQALRQQAEGEASRVVSEVTDQAERLLADARREAEEVVSGYRSHREALLHDLGQIGEWLTSTSSTLNAVLEGASREDVIVVEGGVEQRSTQP